MLQYFIRKGSLDPMFHKGIIGFAFSMFSAFHIYIHIIVSNNYNNKHIILTHLIC